MTSWLVSVNQQALQMANKYKPSPETATFCYHDPGQKGRVEYEAENTKKFGGHKGSSTQNHKKAVSLTIHRIFFFFQI